jgi:hypothetical protein
MDGEDVFGRKITVGYPNRLLERDKKDGSPVKTQSGKEGPPVKTPSGNEYRI